MLIKQVTRKYTANIFTSAFLPFVLIFAIWQSLSKILFKNATSIRFNILIYYMITLFDMCCQIKFFKKGKFNANY